MDEVDENSLVEMTKKLSETPATYGRIIWGLMLERGLNMSALAVASGIDRDIIFQCVKSPYAPSPEILSKLANALDVEVYELQPTSNINAPPV